MKARWEGTLLASMLLGGSLVMPVMAPAYTPGETGDTAVETTALLEAIRTATRRFEDIEVALTEGYVPDPSGRCVSAATEGLPGELGGMGIHYMRPDLLGLSATEPRVNGTGIHTDFLNPAILLYEPQEDGTMKLVGVENLVFQKAWHTAGNSDPPVFAGRTWDAMADDPATAIDEAHGFEPHYDQHVWFSDDGTIHLESFNPRVSCTHHHT